jgi:hypothetical protein
MHGSCALLLAKLIVSRFEISATFRPNWRYLSVNKRYISPIKRYKIRDKRFKIRTIASRLNRLAKSFEIRAMPSGRLGRRDRGGVANHPDRRLFPVANHAPTQSPANRLGLYSLGDAAALLQPLRRLDQVRPRTRPGRPAGKPPIDSIRDSSDLLAALARPWQATCGSRPAAPDCLCGGRVRDSKARILAGAISRIPSAAFSGPAEVVTYSNDHTLPETVQR